MRTAQLDFRWYGGAVLVVKEQQEQAERQIVFGEGLCGDYWWRGTADTGSKLTLRRHVCGDQNVNC